MMASSSFPSFQLVRSLPSIFSAAGIHPSSPMADITPARTVFSVNSAALTAMSEMASMKSVVPTVLTETRSRNPWGAPARVSRSRTPWLNETGGPPFVATGTTSSTLNAPLLMLSYLLTARLWSSAILFSFFFT